MNSKSVLGICQPRTCTRCPPVRWSSFCWIFFSLSSRAGNELWSCGSCFYSETSVQVHFIPELLCVHLKSPGICNQLCNYLRDGSKNALFHSFTWAQVLELFLFYCIFPFQLDLVEISLLPQKRDLSAIMWTITLFDVRRKGAKNYPIPLLK